MKTLALLAVLLAATTASAQALPAGPAPAAEPTTTADPATEPPRADEQPAEGRPGEPTDAPRTDAPQAAGRAVQLDDADLPPAGRVAPVRAPAIDARALPDLTSSPVAGTEAEEPLGPDEYVQGGRRSSGVAFALSGGTTVAGIVMLALAADSSVRDNTAQASLVIGGLFALAAGPTAGHIYAGSPWNTGLKVRLASLGIGVAGGILALAACPPFSGNCNDGGAAIGGIVFFGGGLTYAGATIYEIVDAPRAANRYNMKHRASIAVVPAAAGKPGMSVVGTF